MQAYLDNNATTKPTPEVVQAVTEMMTELWANPSSVHRFGQRTRQRIELAREQICNLINANQRDLIFTSGATESLNLAIRGIISSNPDKRTLITTQLEHSAAREPAADLVFKGVNVVYLPVDINGLINPNDLENALNENKDKVGLVAIHWINNETGAIQPIHEIGQLCRQHNAPFLTDATQAVGKVPCNLADLPIDAMAFSGHKFHGPKGIGALYVRRGIHLQPQILGGPHERERRGGTENAPGIVGLAAAAESAAQFLASDGPSTGLAQRDKLESALLNAIPSAVVNSAGAPRIWNTINISFPPLESEAILIMLSENEICAAAGAACSSGSLEPSPVLLAQGIPEPIAHAAVRLSISKYTTDEQIDYAIQTVPFVVEKVRQSMPAA